MEKTLKILRASFFLLLIYFMATGCGPIKRHARLVKKYPFVHSEAGTITVHDTIRINSVSTDTVFYHKFDTITMTKERLRVQLIRSRDSIYLQGSCLDTTIIRENTYNQFKTTKPFVNYFSYITLILIIILTFLTLRLLFKK